MRNTQRSEILRALLLSLSVIVLAWAFKNFYGDRFRNSDLAWSVAFFRDLFLDHGRIDNWNLSNHTDFFPDKLIALPLWILTKHSYDLLILLYGLCSFFLWIVAAWLLFGSFFSATAGIAAVLALINTGLLQSVFATPFFPTLHFPAFSLALIALVILFKEKSSSWIRALCLVTLFLTFLSDRLIIIYSAVFTGSLLLVDFIQGSPWKQNAKRAIFVLLAAGSVLAIHDRFWNSFTHVSIIEPLPFRELIRNHLHLKKVWAQAFSFLLALAFAPKIKSQVARHRELRPVFIALISAELIPMAILLKFPLETRYVAASAYLAASALVFHAITRLERHKTSITVGLAALAALFFILHLPRAGGVLYHVSEHPLSACLREISRKYPLKSGIGTYWNTHEVNLFGNETHPVRAFGPDLHPFDWVNSKGFYRSEFNFMITRDPSYSLDPAAFSKVLGDGFLEKYPCPAAETEVYILSPAQEKTFSGYLSRTL